MMNNYIELIKRLRVAVDVHEVKGCVLEISAETCAEIADVIEQLVKERDKLQNDLWEANDCLEYANDILKEVETERDAAIADLELAKVCETCEYIQESCDDKCKYKWRGV